MSAPELFGLAVRLVGLGFLAMSIRYAYALVGSFFSQNYAQFATEYAVTFIGAGVASWFLIRHASLLVRVAYPPDDKK